jgi:hypothetical protein
MAFQERLKGMLNPCACSFGHPCRGRFPRQKKAEKFVARIGFPA